MYMHMYTHVAASRVWTPIVHILVFTRRSSVSSKQEAPYDAMTCYAMPCQARLGYAMLCHAMLC